LDLPLAGVSASATLDHPLWQLRDETQGLRLSLLLAAYAVGGRNT